MRAPNKNIPWIILGLLILLDVFLWHSVLFSASGTATRYYFLDVGQGDSELIIFSSGAKLLIDGGPDNKVVSQLGKILSATDRYIDLLLMTHPQLDHFAGFNDVVKDYGVGAILGTGRAAMISAYKDFMGTVHTRNIPYIVLGAGDAIKFGDARLDVLSPNKKDAESPEMNDGCLVTMVTDGPHRALYTCDAGANIEEALVRAYNLSADILKVGHHGSRFSSSADFLSAVKPKIAIIEVGKNSYGHPTKDALSRLADAGARIFRTDLGGNILITFADNALKVYQEK